MIKDIGFMEYMTTIRKTTPHIYKAKQYGIEIINEKDFWELVE